MPKNSEPRMAPIHTSVVAALRASGLRNAGTPLETASMPVRATAPEENARMSMNSDDAGVQCAPLPPVSSASASSWPGISPRSPKERLVEAEDDQRR